VIEETVKRSLEGEFNKARFQIQTKAQVGILAYIGKYAPTMAPNGEVSLCSLL
jgi:hypothetical protein